MKIFKAHTLLTLALLGALPNLALAQAQKTAKLPEAVMLEGAKLYEENCAKCHDRPTDRIPPKQLIASIRTPEDIIEKMTTGTMRLMAELLTPAEIKTLAITLSTRDFSPPGPEPTANMCPKAMGALSMAEASWNGWGRDAGNTRLQHEGGIRPADVPRLKVKWAFAYPGVAYGQPTAVGGKVFVPSRNGTIFALNGATGCTYWSFKADGPVRAAISIGATATGTAAYFADERGTAYAVDALTGKLLWKTLVEKHSVVRIVGAPKLHAGLLYVPTSSMEEVAAGGNPKYPCCTFRGSVVALETAGGKIAWQAFTIKDPPAPTKVNDAGAQMFGPAGGAVWSSPTIDIDRGLLYVGTGDSYTDVVSDSTNAVVAFDLKTGERKWAQQILAHDNWLMACKAGEAPTGNCPARLGPDLDFPTSPILKTLPGGKQILLGVAKGGTAFAFDPDAGGKVIWRKVLGEGNAPNVTWGAAADDNNLYLAMTDPKASDPTQGPGGLYALNIRTGELAWHTPAPKQPVCGWGTAQCSRSQTAAVSLIQGVVFSGAHDGHMRAYSTVDGKLLWDLDTGKSYPGVNGAAAMGGSIDGSPQAIAGGVLFVNSGNTTFSTPRPGNALLAITVDGK